MKLSFSGLRHCGHHVLIDQHIREGDDPRWDQALQAGRITSEGPGELVILSGAEQVNLNGNYWVTLRLNKEEIATLARLALGDDAFKTVVKRLAEPKTRAAAKRRTLP